MLKFKKQKFGSSGPNLLGLLLFLAGVIALVSLFWSEQQDFQKTIILGVVAFGIGIVLMSISAGTIVDLKNQRYQKFESILGFKAGNWESLPPIQKVDLVHHSFSSKNFPNGISPTLTSKRTIYKLALLGPDSVALVLDFESEKDAVEAMEKLNTRLQNLEISSISTSEK